METDAPSPDLSKLTVPLLKALCKKRRITGYSKLGKAALIHKLTGISDACTSPISKNEITSIAILAGPSSVPLEAFLETSDSSDPTSMGIHPADPVTSGSCADIVCKIFSETKPKKQRASNKLKTIGDDSSAINTSIGLNPSIRAETASTSAEFPLVTSFKRPFVSSDVHTPIQTVFKKKKSSSPSSDSLALTSGPSSDTTATNTPMVKNMKSTPNPPPPAESANDGTFKVPALPAAFRQPTNLLSVYTATSVHSDVENLVVPLQSLAAPRVAPFISTTLALPPPATHTVTKATSVVSRTPYKIENTITRLPPKRFQPLVVRKASPPSGALDPVLVTSTAISPALEATPSLASITLPPTLSQRKRVRQWSIILSGLSDEDRRKCTLVSRMFRYAIYLSAVHILTKDFPGRRLELLAQNYSLSMTNMWPYLRLRQQEASLKKEAFVHSFLGKFLKGCNPISERMWVNPDSEGQIDIALRFVLTRLWFLLSIGGHHKDPLAWVVVDVQEIVKGEIWSIKLLSGCNTDIFYVLESTCEVVGQSHPSFLPDRSINLQSGRDIRSDWSSYIDHRILPSSLHVMPARPLLDHLKWQNHEEYEKGISKLWLTRVADEGKLGRSKIVVAERYVLASVVGNSISGKWMSSTQMAQEFEGLPSRISTTIVKAPQVHLFLPAHHHIESVHFNTMNGSPLHPALAVVQTPAREYYVLKDNGMQVGCEEDGVGEVWMNILGCDPHGVVALF